MIIAASDDLKNSLIRPLDALGFLLRDLEIIVSETERPEIDHAEERQPDEAVIETGPEKTRHENCADDQHASHGGRALFHAMQVRRVGEPRPLRESVVRPSARSVFG